MTTQKKRGEEPYQTLPLQFPNHFLIQNRFPLFPIGHQYGKEAIKLVIVVFIDEMDEFMQNYIIDAIFWSLNQLKIEQNGMGIP